MVTWCSVLCRLGELASRFLFCGAPTENLLEGVSMEVIFNVSQWASEMPRAIAIANDRVSASAGCQANCPTRPHADPCDWSCAIPSVRVAIGLLAIAMGLANCSVRCLAIEVRRLAITAIHDWRL